jgi:hypothetical protein
MRRFDAAGFRKIETCSPSAPFLASEFNTGEPVFSPDGRFVLDFDLAYNPACAFSEHYNCPIPPKANKLAVAVRAGGPRSAEHLCPTT